jgi:(p)ppGpp synthase/HD superfamily hydrolase
MLGAGRLNHAIAIAETAHHGQTDKLGRPYFGHCQRVADVQSDSDEKIIAYLHDVVEKGPGWTLTRLAGEGFSQAIITAVDALTKRHGESDDAFVRRAMANQLARPVKKADLEDNLTQVRQQGGDTEKYERGLFLIAS